MREQIQRVHLLRSYDGDFSESCIRMPRGRQDYFPQMVLSASGMLDRVLRARCKNKENVL